jgi:ligand-binding sensor domain-containing protein/tetratricopeptide (TPR) repeat protein
MNVTLSNDEGLFMRKEYLLDMLHTFRKEMRLKFVFTLILLSFFASSIAKAKDLKTYTVADGLLDSTINCAFQDASGILWFGSNKGITRFDGKYFKSFKTSNADERVKVLAIFQDKDSLMWVISEIGVHIWTGSELQETFKYHGLTSFCLDKDGNKWLGSKNGIVVLGEGLDERDEYAVSHIKGVTYLFKDRESKIWIGTDNGLFLYDDGDITQYTTEDGLAGNKINSIYEVGEDMFFTTDGGVSQYNGMLWDSYTTDDGLADNYVTSVFKDFRGKYWFGTKSGLSIYDDSVESFYDAWTKMTTDDGLADNFITCLYLDRSANLWIGTKNGVTKNNLSFDYLFRIQGTKEKLYPPIFHDLQKKIWFSTENGVTSLSEDGYENLTEDDGISGKVLSIFQNPEDEIVYFGTAYGINEYEEGRIIKTHKPVPRKREGRYTAGGAYVYEEVFPEKDEGLVGRDVLSIERDDDGDMWFVTGMALNRLTGSNWTTYTTEEGLLNNKVNDLLLNDDGILYIATQNGINTWFDEEFLDTITKDNGLLHNDVFCMLKDSKGFFWFGTKRGVSRYDGENFKNYSIADGLAGEVVKIIFEDSHGFIWFATEGGLTKYDGENLSIYTTVDGLLENEVLSMTEDDEGIIWFGSEAGIVRYHPDTVAPSSFVANVPEEPIVMPKYTFELAGADLNSTQQEIFFSYKFDDGEWSKFSSKNIIYIDNLQNGTHKLYVKAKDKALNVQKAPLEVSFEVNTKQFDIEIVDIKFNNIFSVLYQYYNSLKEVKESPLGVITLKNKFDKDIKIKINSFIKEYMDYPADTRGKIKAKSVEEIPIRLEFNENILTAPSGFKKINITLQYYLHGENKENDINGNIMVYDKNNITWDIPEKIGAFITVNEKVINNFVRKVIQTYKDESKGSVIYGNLIRAMEIFDALGAYGIRYIADPTSPYSGLKTKKDALDTLRFPKQTLELKSGDCDDCVVLYCTALENIGINTAVIDTYDHVFMMFDVGLKKKDLKQITADISRVFIDDDENVWIPVETTMFGKTFSEAWDTGAKKISKSGDKKSIYHIEDAWEMYKPAEIYSTDEEVAAIKVPSKNVIDRIYKDDVAIQESALISTLIAKYEAVIKEDPESAQAYNSLGIVYGKNGYLEKAEKSFKKVIELRPDYAGGHSNLGNILFEKGYYDKSVKEYKKALILKPDNANVYLELAVTYSMMDDFTNAKKAYLNAIKIDPDIEKKFIEGRD